KNSTNQIDNLRVQILAVALDVWATTTGMGWSTAAGGSASYGFKQDSFGNGTGTIVVNVGSNGAVFRLLAMFGSCCSCSWDGLRAHWLGRPDQDSYLRVPAPSRPVLVSSLIFPGFLRAPGSWAGGPTVAREAQGSARPAAFGHRGGPRNSGETRRCPPTRARAVRDGQPDNRTKPASIRTVVGTGPRTPIRRQNAGVLPRARLVGPSATAP